MPLWQEAQLLTEVVPASVGPWQSWQLARLAFAAYAWKPGLTVSIHAASWPRVRWTMPSTCFPPDADGDLMTRIGGFRGLTEPDEIAALFCFLASDEARSITGAVYTLDNGLTAS